MASATSDLLKLELMTAGENLTTWGPLANQAFDALEEAIAGTTSISTTGGTTVLTDTAFVANQARAMVLDVTGVLASPATIEVPARSKVYLVKNGTTGGHSVSVRAVGQGSAIPTVPANGWAILRVTASAASKLLLEPAGVALTTSEAITGDTWLNRAVYRRAVTFNGLVAGASTTIATLSGSTGLISARGWIGSASVQSPLGALGSPFGGGPYLSLTGAVLALDIGIVGFDRGEIEVLYTK